MLATPRSSTCFMNGQRLQANIIFSLERSLELKSSGLSFGRSKLQFDLRVSFGLIAGAGDTAVKLAAWQYIYGGTNSPAEYVDYNSFKTWACAITAITPVFWTTIPFETARRAYYADKSWPVELRRNYRSPLNALMRIPFEEGIYYLFRGGLPIAAS